MKVRLDAVFTHEILWHAARWDPVLLWLFCNSKAKPVLLLIFFFAILRLNVYLLLVEVVPVHVGNTASGPGARTLRIYIIVMFTIISYKVKSVKSDRTSLTNLIRTQHTRKAFWP